MQNVWRSGERYCRRQEIRENSGTRRRPAGGHLLASGKNRDEVERRRSKASPHRGQKFWKNLFGRDLCLSWNENPDDAPPRTRLAPRGGPHSGRNRHQRTAAAASGLSRSLAVGSIFLASGLFPLGCRCRPDPQALYDRIAQNVRRSDLKTAGVYVDQALAQSCGMDTVWSWRFRIQKALILASSSAPREALALLNGNLPSSLATTDIAVRKNMVEGMAYRISQEFDKAEERLNSAEELARRSHPTMLCEVLNYRGALDFQEKKYFQATAAYQSALDLSRQSK